MDAFVQVVNQSIYGRYFLLHITCPFRILSDDGNFLYLFLSKLPVGCIQACHYKLIQECLRSPGTPSLNAI